MKTFLEYLLEQKKPAIKRKTIALVGGSYKPPHAGHLDMVQKYSQMADKVIVLISDPKSSKSLRKTSLGTVITPNMSKKIWDLYLKRYDISNAEAVVSSKPSPIAALFDYVDSNVRDADVIFGVSKKDDDLSRFKGVQKYADTWKNDYNVVLKDPSETAVEPYASSSGKTVSASDIRAHADDLSQVRDMLPSKLTAKDIDDISTMLSK